MTEWFIHRENLCSNCSIWRFFREPVGELLNDQPIKSWEHSFVLIQKQNHAIVKAALDISPGVAKAMIAEGLKLGLTSVEWERWKNGRAEVRYYNLVKINTNQTVKEE